ncbi:MAG: BREX-1 system phosphatase PglZ type A [Bacteroidales bacterium]|nr:BREX-1 system phosphatase PglZ type A [Bacteroidales bacterium]
MIKKIESYFERNPRLRVLFIFEGMQMLAEELESAPWPEGYHVEVIPGLWDAAKSQYAPAPWLRLKHQIEHEWHDRRVVLIFRSGVYPSSEAQQLAFPLMDVLKANMDFRNESHASFMQQYGLAEKYRGFLQRHAVELQSPKVMAILEPYLTPTAFTEDIACQAMLSVYLGEKRLLDWAELTARLIALAGDKRDKFWMRLAKNADLQERLSTKINDTFNATIELNTLEKMREVAMSLKYNSLTQLLPPDSTDPYRRFKVISTLKIQGINRVWEAGERVKGFAQALDSLAGDIRESELLKIYGADANFYRMTEALAWPIYRHLLEHTLMAEPEVARREAAALRQKLAPSEGLKHAIALLDLLADYYDRASAIGTLKLSSPQDYIDRYTQDWYRFDQLYRKAHEEWEAIRYSMDSEYPSVEPHPTHYIPNHMHQLDLAYSRLMNDMNLEWINCLTEHGCRNFSAVNLPRQSDFYADNYGRTDGKQKLVVIVSDALRFEVAQQLTESIGRTKHIPKLSAMLANLPTETKYCMNTLLPHDSLQFSVDSLQLMVDGKVPTTIEDRAAILESHRAGATAVSYSQVAKNNMATNRELFKRPLVYIYHDTIDRRGHDGDIAGACRDVVKELTALVTSLHASMNVAHVIVTADHGFLYSDLPFAEKDKHQVTEEALEKKTRYYITSNPDEPMGVVKFPLNHSSLTPNPYVAVPKGTNRFAAPGGYNFAHGGASLQEIVVPVLHVRGKEKNLKATVGVMLLSRNLNVVSSRLKVKLAQEDAVDNLTMGREVSVAIWQGLDRVSNEVVLNFDSSEPELVNRVHEVVLTLQQSVTPGLLELRVYDTKDPLNALLKEPVTNSTLLEMDF